MNILKVKKISFASPIAEKSVMNKYLGIASAKCFQTSYPHHLASQTYNHRKNISSTPSNQSI